MTATIDIDELAQSLMKQKVGCKIGSFLVSDALPAEAALKVEEYLSDVTFPVEAARTLLNKLGLTVGEKLIRQHRHGACKCND